MDLPDLVIDAHTHLFPDEVVRDRRRHLEQDAWFGELYAAPDIVLVTPEDMIASMDGAGITTSVVCGWPWRDMWHCREHNDYLADVSRRHPDRIAWTAIVNPAAPGAAAEVERAMAMGAVGVGELNADGQGFSWERPSELAEFSAYCTEMDVPVLIHCSEPVGHPYPGKGTATPDRLLRFIEVNRDLRIVAAHWGGGLPFYELMPEVAELTRNVVYDSAASTYLYRWDVFPVVEKLIGSGRMLFATDYPLLKQRPFLKRVLGSGMAEPGLPELLGGAAARTFGLTAGGTRS